MNKFVIITNNPLVEKELGQDYPVEFHDVSYEGILKVVQDRVYKGHELLTHPLSGSVKPKETPYKSVMISEDIRGLNAQSMHLIDGAIRTCGKFRDRSGEYAPEVFDDFQYVDLTLISSALPSATAW